MAENNFTIHYIITGGTIDSFYDGRKDTVVPNKESVIPYFIESLKLYNGAEFTEVCMKDSRDLNKEDLKRVLDIIEESSHKNILITHGTYTMADTGRYLKANLKRDDQTIILTGSFIPISGFSPSDGPFHLGFSIAKLGQLNPGVYICINGMVYTPEEVMKITSEGRFVSIFDSF